MKRRVSIPKKSSEKLPYNEMTDIFLILNCLPGDKMTGQFLIENIRTATYILFVPPRIYHKINNF